MSARCGGRWRRRSKPPAQSTTVRRWVLAKSLAGLHVSCLRVVIFARIETIIVIRENSSHRKTAADKREEVVVEVLVVNSSNRFVLLINDVSPNNRRAVPAVNIGVLF